MATRLRLIHVNGPLQTLTATSAALQLQERDPMENVLVFNTGQLGAHDSLLRAAVECASAANVQQVVDLGTGTDLAPLQRLAASGGEVAEHLLLHNYALHKRIVDAYPGAIVTIYGDALGQLDIPRDPGLPAVDRIVTPLPQPRTADSMAGIPWEAVRREHILTAMAATRRAVPGLEEADDELASFARGGVLAITGALACMDFGTTPAGEARLIVELVRRSAGSTSSPIVLKPHPRATLGVVNAAARELRRRGHPVRIWSDERYGGYPIELFEETLRAVDRVRSVASSATISLAFIHGLHTDVELDPALAFRTIGPLSYQRFVRMSRYYDDIQRTVREYAGDQPLPQWPNLRQELLHKLAWAAARPLRWSQVTEPLPTREAPWAPEPASTPGCLVIHDSDARLQWAADAVSTLPVEGVGRPLAHDGAPRDRIDRTLDQLADLGVEVFTLTAAVLPPTHLPTWRQAVLRHRRVAVVPGASLRAAQIEELVERRADVLDVEDLPGGTVKLTGRIRRSTTPLQTSGPAAHARPWMPPRS